MTHDKGNISLGKGFTVVISLCQAILGERARHSDIFMVHDGIEIRELIR
jgi:hypothetical protein